MRQLIQRKTPAPLLEFSVKLRDTVRSKQIAPPPAETSTDLVGYETLVEFIQSNNVLSADGDFVEIGTFLGGGAYKLSKFLQNSKSSKQLYVLDIFDPGFDATTNLGGNSMASLYSNVLKSYRGKTQWQIFSEVTRDCKNIIVIKADSKKTQIPSKSLCFCFIDGNHDPEYVQNDFYLIWNKLSAGGTVAFHDYEWDLPQTTAKINELINRHASEIDRVSHDKNKHILFVVKR